RAPIAQIFWPQFERPVSTMDLVVRTARDPETLVPALREAIRSIDKRAPVFNVSRLDRRLDAGLSPRRFETPVLGALAAIAAALAGIGIYGLMHYWVAQRTREIGVRMALGARSGDVARLVLAQAAALAAVGVGAGVAGSLAVARFLSALLFGVTPG